MGHAIGISIVLAFRFGISFTFGLTLEESVQTESVVTVVGGGSVVVAVSVGVGTIGIRPDGITSIAIVLRFGLGLGGHDGNEGSSNSLKMK